MTRIHFHVNSCMAECFFSTNLHFYFPLLLYEEAFVFLDHVYTYGSETKPH